MVQNTSYLKALDKQIEYAGTSDKEIFDFWVDPFGYVTVVNIFNQVSFIDDDLKNINEYGNFQETKELKLKQDNIEQKRFVTNLKQMSQTNIYFDYFEPISNNLNIYYGGNSVTTQILNIEGNGQVPDTSFEVQQNESTGITADSLQMSDTQCFPRYEFVGIEMSEHTPILKQKANRNAFLKRFSTQGLKIYMERPNYGYLRGEQIYVLLYNYRTDQKQQELSGDALSENPTPVMNVSLSGQYYINGMEFEYCRGKLHQVLFLVPITANPSETDLGKDAETISKQINATNK